MMTTLPHVVRSALQCGLAAILSFLPFQASAQDLGSGTAPTAIGGGAITGLTCNTLYHFRAVGTNAATTPLVSALFIKPSSPLPLPTRLL